MEEIWKDIPRYKGIYQASNLGRIKNIKKGNILLGCKDKDGYMITTLRKNNQKRTEKIHRLVAESFLLNPDNYPVINHKDENRANNRIENLEWCSVEYNNSYSKSKLLGQYDTNMQLIKTWKNANQVEKELKIWAANIRNCCNDRVQKAGGYIWKYV